jgi:glycosyltransferase involved in cell wall biosynthesis
MKILQSTLVEPVGPCVHTPREMAPRPAVSVITIFWNAERFIRDAIESVLEQTFEDWELLLVDDGSTDASTRIARDYAAAHPDKIRYLEHPGHVNNGMSAARNLGIEAARGEYLGFLDADDIWLPYKLEEQIAILRERPEVDMLFGYTQYWRSWNGEPEELGKDRILDPGVPLDTVIEPPALLTTLYPLGVASGRRCRICSSSAPAWWRSAVSRRASADYTRIRSSWRRRISHSASW